MNPNKKLPRRAALPTRHTLPRRHILTLRHLSLVCGLLVLVICTAVPLPALDYNTPFTARMVRHVGLLLLAAPLLAMAIPPDNLIRKPLTNLSRLTARRPVIAWLAGIFTMWLWHLPVLYNLSLTSGGILSCSPFLALPAHAAATAHLAATAHVAATTHAAATAHAAAATLSTQPTALPIHAAAAAAAQTAALPVSVAAISLPTTITATLAFIHTPSLLLAGFLFCWPLITPYPSFRLPALQAILYLASACITCSLAGLLITYAPQGMFRGVTTHDQQSGGLIMWVPCCFLYLSASMALLIRWLSQKEPVSLLHS